MHVAQWKQTALGALDWAACCSCRLHSPRTPCHSSQLLQHRHHAGHSLASRTVPRARLPHMDEELEHMQWQLDKRTQGDTGSSSSGHSSRRKPNKRLVFHDRASSKHGRNQQQLRHHHQHHSNSSSAARTLDTGASSSDEAAVAAAGAVASDIDGGTSLQQQQQQAGLAADDLFYCLQLSQPGVPDLAKAQERLARHIHRDGGCCIATNIEHAATLTQLLLLLQHKQLHRKSELWGSDTLLLLQPLNCDAEPGDYTAAAATAVAAQGGAQAHAHAHAAGQEHKSSLVQSGTGTQHINCACPVDELRFFVTFMPFTSLLVAEHARAASQSPVGSTQQERHGGPSSSMQSWLSAAESSTDDTPAGHALFSNSGSSSRHGRASSSSNSSSAELLRAAGSDSSSRGAASVLHDAASRGCLHSIHIRPHADAAAVAAHIPAAVAAGEVLALHCKGTAAAHAAAYAALELANKVLSASSHAQPLGFGVLVVQGLRHEHVHARTHGHSSASSSSSMSSLDLQHAGPGAAAAAAAGAAPGAAAAAAEGMQHHHQAHGRAVLDASMDVGGFGAAFYGLGAWGDRGSEHNTQQGVLHKHVQEVWLCVVPLDMAE